MDSGLLLQRHEYSTPLSALRVSSRTQLSKMLNVKMDHVDCDIGLMCDFIGLAELVGFCTEQIRYIESTKDPTAELLRLWEELPDLNPTVGKLWEYLIELKRYDVMSACKRSIDRDLKCARGLNQNRLETYMPTQMDCISSRDDHNVNELDRLTVDDTQYFDAYVCHSMSERDLVFVKEMIENLEEKKGLKLCIPGRDDLPGGAKYVTDAAIIKSRCRMMIIVLSTDYFKSAACEFQVKFATALSPCTQHRKMIPVLIEPLRIPDVLRYMSLCDFTKKDLIGWFWDRLAKAVTEVTSTSWREDKNDVTKRTSQNTCAPAESEAVTTSSPIQIAGPQPTESNNSSGSRLLQIKNFLSSRKR